MARDTWYRLDNIGTYYAAQAGRRLQTVFRYAAAMDEEVDPEVLQQALDRAVDRFPTFAVSLRTGLFWHYLVEAPAPRVRPEDQPICAPLHAGRSSVLCRVSWYGDRINFEVSHIVSDGRGSLAFFKELLRTYVALRYDVEVPESYTGSLTQSSEARKRHGSFRMAALKRGRNSCMYPRTRCTAPCLRMRMLIFMRLRRMILTARIPPARHRRTCW